MSKVHRVFWSYFGYFMLIMLSCFLLLLNYIESGNILRGRILINELYSIRSSVITYKLLNKVFPKDLSQAIGFMCANTKNCIDISEDHDNNYIDPFGKKYVYDEKTGFVIAGDEKYINW